MKIGIIAFPRVTPKYGWSWVVAKFWIGLCFGFFTRCKLGLFVGIGFGAEIGRMSGNTVRTTFYLSVRTKMRSFV